jgi:hypothetical protein
MTVPGGTFIHDMAKDTPRSVTDFEHIVFIGSHIARIDRDGVETPRAKSIPNPGFDGIPVQVDACGAN